MTRIQKKAFYYVYKQKSCTLNDLSKHLGFSTLNDFLINEKVEEILGNYFWENVKFDECKNDNSKTRIRCVSSKVISEIQTEKKKNIDGWITRLISMASLIISLIALLTK